MPITRLILVRHSETLANRDFRYIGTRDEALSERGIIQAEQLAAALAAFPVAAIYSSPLQRACRTAQTMAARHNLDVRLLDALRECDFGTWEGLSRAEVLARSVQDAEHLHAWEHDPTLAPPAGESFAAMQERMSVAVANLAQEHPDQTIILVSHVGPIKALLCTALGAPLTTAFRIFLDPATISVVDWQEGRSIVRLINSHAHLGWEQARWITKT